MSCPCKCVSEPPGPPGRARRISSTGGMLMPTILRCAPTTVGTWGPSRLTKIGDKTLGAAENCSRRPSPRSQPCWRSAQRTVRPRSSSLDSPQPLDSRVKKAKASPAETCRPKRGLGASRDFVCIRLVHQAPRIMAMPCAPATRASALSSAVSPPIANRGRLASCASRCHESQPMPECPGCDAVALTLPRTA